MKRTTISTMIAAMLLGAAGRMLSQSPQLEPARPAAISSNVKAAQPTAQDLTQINLKLKLSLDQSNEQLKQVLQSLQAIKAANQLLIEKQQKSLEQLDAMQKESDQIRILGKRS